MAIQLRDCPAPIFGLKQEHCNVCVAGFSSTEDLENHQKWHYISYCVICSEVLPSPLDLVCHMRERHSKTSVLSMKTKTNKIFNLSRLQECVSGFDGLYNLEKYLCWFKPLLHLHSEKNLTCSFCYVKFKVSYSLYRHMCSHWAMNIPCSLRKNFVLFLKDKGRGKKCYKKIPKTQKECSIKKDNSFESDIEPIIKDIKDFDKINNRGISGDEQGSEQTVSNFMRVLPYDSGISDLIIDESQDPDKIDQTADNKNGKDGIKEKRYNKSCKAYQRRKIMQCIWCEEVFPSASFIRYHIQKFHCDLSPLRCCLCDKKFKNETARRLHEQLHTQRQQLGRPDNFVKPPAKRLEKDYHKKYLQKKLNERKCTFKKKVDSSACPFECSTCLKRFSSMYTFSAHIKLHDGFKGYQCPKKLFCKSKLRVHERRHIGLYNCPYCKMGYTRKCNLNCHIIQYHTMELPFPCPVCDLRYPTRKKARVHLFRHAKCFYCHICSFHSGYYPSLVMHLKIHGNGQEVKKEPLIGTFSCVVCGDVITNSYALRKHLSTHIKPVVYTSTAGDPYTHDNTTPLSQGEESSNEREVQNEIHTKNILEEVNLTEEKHTEAEESNNYTVQDWGIDSADKDTKVHLKDVDIIEINKSEPAEFHPLPEESINTSDNHAGATIQDKGNPAEAGISKILANLDKKTKKKLGRRSKCKKCGEMFTSRKEVLSHSAIHNIVYQCQFCSKRLASDKLKSEHEEMHRNNPFMCQSCKACFPLYGQLTVHQEDEHPESQIFRKKKCISTPVEKLPAHVLPKKIARNTTVSHVKNLGMDSDSLIFSVSDDQSKGGEHIEKVSYFKTVIDCDSGLFTYQPCTSTQMKKSSKVDTTMKNHKNDNDIQYSHTEKQGVRFDKAQHNAGSVQTEKTLGINAAMESGHVFLPVECNVCGIMMETAASLENHTDEHYLPIRKGNPHPCVACDQTLDNRQALRDHFQSHIRQTKKRSTSHMEFRQEPLYATQTSTVHPYMNRSKCSICSDTFATVIELNRHSQMVHKERFPFLCQLCKQGYIHQFDLFTHLASQHHSQELEKAGENTEQPTFICIYCYEQFPNEEQLSLHSKSHTLSREVSILCNLCNEQFKSNDELMAHLKLHLRGQELEGQHSHLSSLVNQNEGRSYRLAESTKGDHEEQSEGLGGIFQCPSCPIKYDSVILLEEHIKTHTLRQEDKRPTHHHFWPPI